MTIKIAESEDLKHKTTVKSADNIYRNEGEWGYMILSTPEDSGLHFGKAHPSDTIG